MPASALALVLAAALLHALWNVAAKKAGGDRHFALICALGVVLLWAPVAAWSGFASAGGWGWVEWGLIVFSALVHVAYFLALLRGYRLADLTVVYPVARGSGPLLSAVGAAFLLGESLSPTGAFGVIAVCGGVFLVAGGPGLWRRAHDAAARARLAAGLRWGVITGALIASYTVIDAWAIKRLQLHPLAFDYWCNLLRIPLLLPLVWRLAAPGSLVSGWRAERRAVLLIGACSPMAYILVLWALQTAPLSAVAPARECSMLFAALLGGQLLKEGDRAARLLGAGAIAVGVALLGLTSTGSPS